MDNIIKCNKEIHESFGKTAANIIMYFEGDSRQTMLKQLRGEVEKLCTIEEQLKSERKISQEIAASYNPNDENTDNDNNNLVAEYKNKLSQMQPELSKNENMIEFDRIVKALEDAHSQGGANGGGEDDELQLTRDAINLIDPVTKRRMTDPVRNTICGHVYDRDSVKGLLSQNPQTRCPVPGCKFKEYLSMEKMKSDIVTKTYLDKNPA